MITNLPSLQLERALWIRQGLPSLSLKLQEAKPAPELAAELQALVDPCLVEFRVQVEYRTPYLESSLTEILRQCPALEQVELSYISAEGVKAVAALPALRDLTVSRVTEVDESAVEETAFPALQTLNMFWTMSDRVIGLLRQLSTARDLVEVAVPLRSPTTSPANYTNRYATLLQTLAQNCNPGSLSRLSLIDDTLYGPSRYRQSQPFYTLLYDHLRPLRPLRALTKLHIAPWGHVDLEDSDVEALSSSWPLLEELRVERSPQFAATTEDFPIRTTHRSLLSIAKHCTNLAHLEFTFDVTGLSDGNGRPGEGLTQTALEHLHLGDSIWGDTRTFALFLSDLFPSLKVVSSDAMLAAELTDEGDETPLEYLEVQKLQELVSCTIEARLQERMYLAQQ